MIHQLTNKQSIPVWHKRRGKDKWLELLSDYKYVAVGGIVTQEIKKTEHHIIFPYLIKTAKTNNVKVHALGFTDLEGLTKYPFYSVDSTYWLYGNRSGVIYLFKKKTIRTIRKPNGTRLKSREVAINNFKEWVKFQRYAQVNL